MADNKKSIFQRLNTIFDASGIDLTKVNQTVNKYSINNDVLLKTQSKEEYEAAKLQAQQSKFLGGVWRKTENELIQHSMHYETTRIGSYADFESMEFYPEIAAALDIMMEECLAGSTMIPLLNGSELTMKEIYDNNLTDFWVYSVDLETNKIKPSKVEKAILKGIKKVFKITLDDDTELLCTDNHKWLRYDNTWVETKDLLFGDSLKIISRKLDYKGYEKVSLTNFNGDTKHTHIIVAESELIKNKENLLLNDRARTEKGYNNLKDLKSTIGNHRVIKVEYYGEEEVYDLVNSSVSQNFAIKCNNGLVISHNCTTVNNKGRVLNVYSDSKRIQGILEDLFFNRLDLHASLPMWTRNICKYGDNFLLLNIDDKKGIVGARQLPNFEIERREGDIVQNQYSGEWTVNNEGEDAKVKFMWRGRDMEFNSWQIAHFRLLGDDRRLPYGTSILEKARRIWKQLQLSEDAMLVYRVTRAPERRVYKIYVGNIDEKDVPQYVDDIANRFKRKPVIDPQTGQIDLRYNQLANDQDYFIPVRDENAATPIDTLQGACIALDTRIPLLDGRVLELNQIINEWDNGNRNLWVYSCNPITGELAPGMITWAGETRKNTEVIKITLDNGESITTTPDHKWVHRTKGFVEAKDLRVGESLMPFYRDRKKIKSNTNGDYERIWDSAKQEWVFTHRMVTDLLNDFNEEQYHTFEDIYEKNNKEKSLLYNHKIISIEWLENKIDTGTITVDGNELYHNYHTFATESGVFIKNSNLDQIADIQYLQRKLFTALRVPKTFLGFEEATGEGKNLAMQDIRFSRTINRIQQAMIVELNKIAIIHLYMLGFEDEISNFNLSLNNPSTQAKMLEIEQLQAKMTLYKDAVSEAGNGFMGMSMTRARRDILGWSDEEIKKDFLEQRLEKAAAAEIENTSAVIKHTGMFDEVDGIYGDINAAIAGAASEGGEGGDSGLGGGGGGSFGGGGGFGGATETPEAGEPALEGGEPALEGGEEAPAETPEAAPEETLAEQIKKTNQLLTENTKQLNQRKDKYSKMFVNRLIDNIEHKETIINERVAIYDKTLKINEDINGMINDIDNMLKD